MVKDLRDGSDQSGLWDQREARSNVPEKMAFQRGREGEELEMGERCTEQTYTGLRRCPGAGRRAGKTQMAVWGQQQKLETEQSSMALQLQIKVQETEERNREKGMGPQ